MMKSGLFRGVVAALGAAFLVYFAMVVVPPLLVDPDVPGAFAAGFVNPYASGYSMDVIVCWLILCAWILHERTVAGVRHGLWCIPLGLFPGVAVGFALYLLLRMRQGIGTGTGRAD